MHRYLSVPATLHEVQTALEHLTQVDSRHGLYFLAGHDDHVAIRLRRESASRPHFERAVRYGRILGLIPFVRMVALTGSLAVLNLSKGADIDYMLVTAPRHLWTARAFAVTLGRFLRLFGSTICVNLIVSENALAWPLHDLYSAREMCQMIPVTGFDVYHRLRAANPWTEEVLPNSGLDKMRDYNPALHKTLGVRCNMESDSLLSDGVGLQSHTPYTLSDTMREQAPAFQKLFELPLRQNLGARLEAWTVKFQLHRIGHHAGTSDEVNFSADVCQGNFHQHRHWAAKFFHQRLVELGLADGPRKSPRVYP